MTRQSLLLAALTTLVLGTATARAVNWPSASGTTAPGVVLEDGAGNKASISGGTITIAPANSTGGQNAITVTSTSASLLALRVAPKYGLSVKNESLTASIAICFGSCTAALNTAGSITIPPGIMWSASPAYIPLDAINGISSAATSPATIQAN